MNLFHLSSIPVHEEFCELLLPDRGVRIERIVSAGQASPAGFGMIKSGMNGLRFFKVKPDYPGMTDGYKTCKPVIGYSFQPMNGIASSGLQKLPLVFGWQFMVIYADDRFHFGPI